MLELLARLAGADPSQYNRFELAWRDLGWLGSGLAVGLSAAVIALGWWGLRSARHAPRRLIYAARLIALALLLVIVFGPSIELRLATRAESRVALLVDTSGSMALEAGRSSRLAEALSALEAPRFRQLFDGRVVEVYGFSSGLEPTTLEALASAPPAGRRTSLSGALAALETETAERKLSAVVIASDGASPELFAPGAIELRLPSWPSVPYFTYAAGAETPFKDVAIARPRHQSFGFVRHELGFDVTLVARGFAGTRLAVVLKEDGAPVMTQDVVIASDIEEQTLTFRFTPERPGTFLYSIATPVLAGEAIETNNAVSFAMTVRRDQIRVLQLAGRPGWDVRFLRQALKLDPNIDLVSFFILRDFEDPPGVPQDELSLIPFPVAELFSVALDEFDVVIFQDFNRRQFLTEPQLDNLRLFVEQGGGFLIIGGDLSFSSGGFSGSAVEDVLPMKLVTGSEVVDLSKFKPTLTAAGRRHYITRFEPNGTANESLWAGLAELDGANLVGELNPGGVALLEHPTLKVGGRPLPVLATRTVGRGRTLAFTADSSWYWSFRDAAEQGTSRAYNELWRNSIRWLAHEQTSKFVSVELASEVVEAGASVSLGVRARGVDYEPLAGGRLAVEVNGAVDGHVVLSERGVTHQDGRWERKLDPLPAGFYRVRVFLEESDGVPIDEDQALFEVASDQSELVEAAPRPDVLERLAQLTGGASLGAGARTPELVEPGDLRVSRRERVALWDNGFVFGALLLALAAEWWLRRRAGLV